MKMTFDHGSYIIYKTKGACRIDDIRTEKLCGEVRTYYVLHPVRDAKEEILVPIDSEMLLAQMHPVLTTQEMDTVITACKDAPELDWIPEMRPRAERFKGLLLLPDRTLRLRLIRTIRAQRSALNAVGKKLCATDDAILQKAEALILDEFSILFHEDLAASANRLTDVCKK